MNANTRFSRNLPCVWALLALSAGCAGLHPSDPPIADVALKRQQRTEEVAREFESKRDFAEFQAALAHRNQGNVEACEQGLRRLLKRNPDHRQARLLMAELGKTDEPSLTVLDPAEGALRDATGEGKNAPDYYELAAKLAADGDVHNVGHRTPPRHAQQDGPSPAGPTEHAGDASGAADGPNPAAADPTTQTAKSASTLAGEQLPSAGSADDASPPSATPDPASQEDPSDYAGSAETAETGRVRASVGKGREAPAEDSDQAALVHFRRAATTAAPDDPQIPIAAAMEALRRNRPDLAIELLGPARRRSPDSARLHRILGVAFYRLGDYDSSQVALRQALSLDKSSALAYFLMGCTLSKLGQLESAEAHWRQARAIDPRYTPIRQGQD